MSFLKKLLSAITFGLVKFQETQKQAADVLKEVNKTVSEVKAIGDVKLDPELKEQFDILKKNVKR